MACGLPVITTDTQGPLSYIENGKNGFIIHKGNEMELFEQIKILRENPVLRKTIGLAAAKYVSENFSDYSKLISLYNEFRGV